MQRYILLETVSHGCPRATVSEEFFMGKTEDFNDHNGEPVEKLA